MGILRRCFVPTLALIAPLTACGGSSGTGIPDACNPLGGEGCMLPWPSMVYAKADSSSTTGFRVAIPTAAMPVNLDNVVVDPSALNRRDGFSPVSQLLAAFPTGVSGDGLPSWKDPSQSLTADAPIVLVASDNGERVPYFAEVDQNVPDPKNADLIIRPLARMRPGIKYVVGIRNTVKAADGSALPVSPGFAALRDGKGFDHPLFKTLQAESDTIFGALATAGVQKSELVLAWDFVTASDEYLQQDLTMMKAAALPQIGDTGANITFTTTEQTNASSMIYKSYVGTYKSPTFLTDGENDDSVIARDSAGLPMFTGMRDANFAALIPNCVMTQSLPRPTIIFGHGLFGSAKDYLTDGFVQSLAEQYCFIIIAGDFIGLTSRQISLAPLAVNDMNRAPQIAEKLGQSVIDFMTLENAARGPMATSPAFMVNGQSVIDPTHTYYVGGSLGGIMGNTIMAYDPNLVRGVLAVPGGDWSLLFERSNAWHLLMGAAQGAYTDLSVYQLNIAFLGLAMEPYDAITTAAHVLHDNLPGVPAKNILMWYSVGDCLVTNISTELVARTMGIPMLSPSVSSPWNLPTMNGPMPNGINLFNDHPMPLPPDTNVPPLVDNGTHSGINRKPAALRLIQQFLFQDQVVPECLVNNAPAPCDCATGACD